MTSETIMNILWNGKYENFYYGSFNVSICYYGGMFCIDLVGGWNDDEQVPEYGFGTSFGSNMFHPGFDKAFQAALNNIRNSNNNLKIKDAAESALARACVEFQLKHRGMQ